MDKFPDQDVLFERSPKNKQVSNKVEEKVSSVKRLKVSDQPVNVFVMTNNSDGAAAQLVGSYFDADMFKVRLTTVETLGADSEYQRLVKVLRKSKIDGMGSIIVVKDNSVSNASPELMSQVVRAAMSLEQYDIVYLGRWQDNCSALSEGTAIAGTSSRIFTTKSPGGLQAILINPSGRDKILGEAALADGSKFERNISVPLEEQIQSNIRAGEISAGCVVPNLIEFNLKDAKKPSDYAKTAECGMVCQEKDQKVIEEPEFLVPEKQLEKKKFVDYLKLNKNGRRHPGLIVTIMIALVIAIALGIWLILSNKNKQKEESKSKRVDTIPGGWMQNGKE